MIGDYPQEFVQLNVGLLYLANLEGNFVQKTCSYEVAVMEVPIVIKDGIVALPDDQSSWRFVVFANNTKKALEGYVPGYGIPKTLDGFTFGLLPYVNANAVSTISNSQDRISCSHASSL